ncbi:conserved hypothetical protein [Geotrichum candidum]|uniref:Transcription factor CBF/NF-Y/archaeal histone domain-containing protein n=1 Tax=Geotrichum candidum TaxID=1173061 RepID=A0A0J9XFF1_GEOCN|nr:conserved hypothetical protein [Geotrichum candidum]
MSRLYPKSTFKRSIKEYSDGAPLTKNADALLYLDYVLFLKSLIQKAEEEAADSNEKQISRRHIEKHIQDTLREFKG